LSVTIVTRETNAVQRLGTQELYFLRLQQQTTANQW